jgi:hypothetical protein
LNSNKDTKTTTLTEDSQKRRGIVKSLAFGGAVAGTVWTKPVVMSVIAPAHAETSGGPIMLSGGTDQSLNTSNDTGNTALEALLAILPDVIQTAEASLACGCFYVNEFTNCVTVELALKATGVAGTVTLDQGSGGGSDSATFILGGDRSIPKTSFEGGCLWIQGGIINEDFSIATGTIGDSSLGTCAGGNWTASAEMPPCTPGNYLNGN